MNFSQKQGREVCRMRRYRPARDVKIKSLNYEPYSDIAEGFNSIIAIHSNISGTSKGVTHL